MVQKGIDWSQLWYPGPKRMFSADEMARAGNDSPSPTLVAAAGVNFAAVAFVILQFAPASQTARLTAALVALAVLGSATARWLWWRPWRQPLMFASLGLAVLLTLLSAGMRTRISNRDDRYAVGLVIAIGCALLVVVLWFLVVWRAQQIEARLREQAEREKSIEMARRLANAQLEPHFLFNTLASLQHWVQTQDPHASTLLEALTGYLRATLPMFSRALQPAADELHAVHLYLQVMQARLGARLTWHIDIDPALQSQALPPGLLLTLVENAIEHGVEPRLAGGRVSLRGVAQAGMAVFQVHDNGAGPAPGSADGIGLANSRERLALTCGPRASLTLSTHPEGGGLAEVRLPRHRVP